MTHRPAKRTLRKDFRIREFRPRVNHGIRANPGVSPCRNPGRRPRSRCSLQGARPPGRGCPILVARRQGGLGWDNRRPSPILTSIFGRGKGGALSLLKPSPHREDGTKNGASDRAGSVVRPRRLENDESRIQDQYMIMSRLACHAARLSRSTTSRCLSRHIWASAWARHDLTTAQPTRPSAENVAITTSRTVSTGFLSSKLGTRCHPLPEQRGSA